PLDSGVLTPPFVRLHLGFIFSSKPFDNREERLTDKGERMGVLRKKNLKNRRVCKSGGDWSREEDERENGGVSTLQVL
ncbi:hypothetical protein CCACVL1_05045, partial [Corchorus capsularis]